MTWQAQLAVKNIFMRSEMSSQGMELVWPTKSRLGGSDMLQWGGGEAYDPNIKGEERLVQKTMTKYFGNYAHMKDVSRFSIYYPDPAALLQGLRALRSTFYCAKVENRFRVPTVLGWRDVTILVEVTLPGSHKRHLCEIQLQLQGYANVRQVYLGSLERPQA